MHRHGTLHALCATGATVGDLVWNDVNQNGVQDAGELGLAGVVVQLVRGGVVVASTTSSSSGQYAFSNVTAGTYTLVFQPPSGYAISPAQQGGSAMLDSDVANSLTGATSPFNVSAGQLKNDIDAGMYRGVPGMLWSCAHLWSEVRLLPPTVSQLVGCKPA